jgi:hypothetical protein
MVSELARKKARCGVKKDQNHLSKGGDFNE